MEPYKDIIITLVVAIIGSNGIWALILAMTEKKSSKNNMILGLGHDRIIFLEKKYIKRGYITPDEYENLHDYLYVPYRKMGGNGTAEKLMQIVDSLPIENNHKGDSNNDS